MVRSSDPARVPGSIRLGPICAIPALLLAAPGHAQDLRLRLPLDCTLGETCFIQQYVDADPGPGHADFTGGPLSYDGHKGTDFRVSDLEAMALGVPVLAPARGTVRGTRDGMPDRIMTDRADVADRECGNGVAISHDDGWETQLCHLAQGSVLVDTGDAVEAGQPIGRIGLSGASQFPHVHIAVRRDGEVVDPFVEGLWLEAPAYEPGGLLSAGFADGIPEYEQVKAGTADAADLPADAPALVLWGSVFGGRAGDVIGLTITGPDGNEVFEQEIALERTQAELFRAAGRRLRAERWDPGAYAGRVILMRDGQEIDRLDTQVVLR
ncbi:M23 family metallopeptidase [Jannaschia sp. S6380]|uniref:M23 family metallopeptidase n=1 Tax=Jannaschia sp. S6380 TaxID=2926408 RepID=UPI001FF4948E|nr:M23 family metallopeptidase [Jannaschia sp. S6380]MCK0168010.1 M23 family metallopeptidase [Jannaschia sp. S6380]